MASTNGTAQSEPTHSAICNDLHDVAARLAGVTDTLRKLGDTNPDGIGNIVLLMADVAEDANEKICVSAGCVRELAKGGAA